MFLRHGLIRKRARLAPSRLLFPAACAFFAAAGLTPARATETALYDFKGKSGAMPLASLIADARGDLYGTTYYGGTGGWGVVFKLSPPASGQEKWTETVLHSFTGGADGGYPQVNVIIDARGSLYGTTLMGGANTFGVVFKLTPPASGAGPWTETILHNFGSSSSDGEGSQGGLVFDAHGALYGTTSVGGTWNAGTVFKLTPPTSSSGTWTETILYSFQGRPDGVSPSGNLVFDSQGALYGTTSLGGASVTASDFGTVFKLTPPSLGTGPWTETVLYSFKGTPSSDGTGPMSGVIIDKQGALYGATFGGGVTGANGTVFKLTPPAIPSGEWTEQVLHSFTESQLSYPIGSLFFDAEGKLYGVTQSGGSFPAVRGAVYSLTAPASGSGAWTSAVLYQFTCESGSGCEPQAGLMQHAGNGALYGTTSYGGPGASQNGAVYELQCTKWSEIGKKRTCVGW